jgi:aspartyl-tRNA(Asn)/glutamyl-tRNA(Gln) amidotransferase subunit A
MTETGLSLVRRPLAAIARDLAAGIVTSTQLVEEALERIADPAGEGARAFLTVYPEGARVMAQAIDAMRREGMTISPLAGIPISLKEAFEVAGSSMHFGSRVYDDGPKATRDAAVIRRIRAAGLVMVGRTNLPEFAFSTAGLNPHYGTPRNPYDRATGRTPGGSSSGAVVSVTDGMASVALASDTGGSIRVPAALCGVTGFKPTARRVPLQGAGSLAKLLDSAGPIGHTVTCCAMLDAVLRDEDCGWDGADTPPLSRLRFGVLRNYVTDDMDDTVAAAYERALADLHEAGALLVDVTFPEAAKVVHANAKGGMQAAESYARHQHLLPHRAAEFDPRILARVMRGQAMTAADYLDTLRERAEVVEAFTRLARGFDALLLPTAPIVAPPLAAFEGDDGFFHATQMKLLKSAGLINFVDGCAITLPIQAPGAAPVGLSLAAAGGSDEALLRMALAVERLLRPGAAVV